MKRSTILLAAIGVLGLLFVTPYLSLGDPSPLTPQGRFARIAGFKVPEELGGQTFVEVTLRGARHVTAHYSDGATLAVGAGGPASYYENWDAATALHAEERGAHFGPHTSALVDVRGVGAYALQFTPIPGGRVRLTWATDHAVIVLELVEGTLEDAIEIAEGL